MSILGSVQVLVTSNINIEKMQVVVKHWGLIPQLPSLLLLLLHAREPLVQQLLAVVDLPLKENKTTPEVTATQTTF